jgi:predicted metalloendopeptidase
MAIHMTFPYIGRQFDKSGNLKQWWDDDVIAKFKEKAQCIVDQYGNYTVPEVGVNVGISVQSEFLLYPDIDLSNSID